VLNKGMATDIPTT